MHRLETIEEGSATRLLTTAEDRRSTAAGEGEDVFDGRRSERVLALNA